MWNVPSKKFKKKLRKFQEKSRKFQEIPRNSREIQRNSKKFQEILRKFQEIPRKIQEIHEISKKFQRNSKTVVPTAQSLPLIFPLTRMQSGPHGSCSQKRPPVNRPSATIHEGPRLPLSAWSGAAWPLLTRMDAYWCAGALCAASCANVLVSSRFCRVAADIPNYPMGVIDSTA